jgi:molybdate transport system substrate-binding protein
VPSVIPGALATILVACGPRGTNEQALLVSAAVSLTEPLTVAAARYEQQRGVRVQLNLAASNVLASQALEGAPVDVFLSADAAQVDRLAAAGLTAADTRVDFLSNALVVVVPSDRPTTLTSLEDLAEPRFRRLALANPASVPAGVYAKAALERAGLWAKVEPRVVPGGNVRAALAAVENGSVDAGFVYRTDARQSTRVRVAFTVPEDPASPIRYQGVVLRTSRQPETARRFLDWLHTPDGQKPFLDAGFLAPR